MNELEPVTFRYKVELDPKGVRQFGLIAEQAQTGDSSLAAAVLHIELCQVSFCDENLVRFFAAGGGL